MTNKVKPFYIRITDDMTPQMVQDAFDKCVDAGADANDCIENTAKKNDGWGYFGSIHDWGLFGVCKIEGTWLGDNQKYMSCNAAQEITLDQLDEWLGLEVKDEWSGEGLPPVGIKCEFKEKSPSGVSAFSDWSKCRVLAYNNPEKPSNEIQIIIRDDRGDAAIIYSCDEPVFRKPETPEQKAERERLEAAYDLYCNAQHSVNVIGYDSFGVFKSDKVQVKFWLSIVDKTGYRKQ